MKRADHLSATARMQASRGATQRAVQRELAWASIGSRLWPSYLFYPAKAQANLPAMLCIESPKGPICYRLALEDLLMFEHVTDRRDEGPEDYKAGSKDGVLLALATDGSWTIR